MVANRISFVPSPRTPRRRSSGLTLVFLVYAILFWSLIAYFAFGG